VNKDAESLAPAESESHRLHPITLVQRFILSLPGFAAVLLATYRSPDSANWVSLIATIAYALIALPLIYLRYVRFSYWITPRELVIQSGVFTRQHRSIPLEKIQNVSIVQRLLPRLTATASVQVVTAGSTTAEGVLEFVSLSEARRIREIVRAYRSHEIPQGLRQTRPQADDARQEAGSGRLNDSIDEKSGRNLLLELGLGRVLLSGAFRFSLLYIAIIFSLLQFFQPDPEALTQWLLQERYAAFVAAIRAAPGLAALLAIMSAALLSWASGIAVNLNKFYRFRLWEETDKVTKRTGLLTVSERSIPKRKIQAVIIRSNPLMVALDWWSASVQTIGHDVSKQGYAVVAPLVRWQELQNINGRLTSVTAPTSFQCVSKRRAGRLTVRYVFGLVGVAAGLSLVWHLWWTVLFAAPVLAALAFLQWRAHGFALAETGLAIRRGLIKRQMWLIPYSRMQVFYAVQSIFQRRRDLKSVYVDTAGASNMSAATIYDLRTDDAEKLMNLLYSQFIDRTS
jgi:putative membrane protein